MFLDLPAEHDVADAPNLVPKCSEDLDDKVPPQSAGARTTRREVRIPRRHSLELKTGIWLKTCRGVVALVFVFIFGDVLLFLVFRVDNVVRQVASKTSVDRPHEWVIIADSCPTRLKWWSRRLREVDADLTCRGWRIVDERHDGPVVFFTECFSRRIEHKRERRQGLGTGRHHGHLELAN